MGGFLLFNRLQVAMTQQCRAHLLLAVFLFSCSALLFFTGSDLSIIKAAICQ
jgi:hypothetical protein